MNRATRIAGLGFPVVGSGSVLSAARFAADAHAAVRQVRKYTGEPYIGHPAAVATLVAEAVNYEPAACGGYSAAELQMAAWLHDTVEDTDVTSTDVHQEFGSNVGELVGWLTDVSQPSDGNRAARKQKDLEHLAGAPAAAQTIKLADLIDNTGSIVRHDPAFARVYLREKDALLGVLTKGSATLWGHARRVCDDGLASLVD